MSDEKEEIFRTNNDTIVPNDEIYPLSDAHMHIQGNDIAPIPIMKGIILKKMYDKKLSLNPKNQINIAELSYLNSAVDIKEIYEKKEKDNFLSSIFANFELYSLTNLLTECRRFVQFFLGTGIAGRYGKLGKLSSYELSKIYLDEESSTSFGFQWRTTKKKNNLKSSKSAKKYANKLLEEEKENITKTFKQITSHYYGEDKFQKELKWQFSISHQMELLYAHFWGAAGIPIYLFFNNKAYFISNCTSFLQKIKSIRHDNNIKTLYEKRYLHNVYDFSVINKTIKDKEYYYLDLPKIDLEKRENWEKIRCLDAPLANKYYIHFLKEMTTDEIYKFEDYNRHIFFNKLAILNQPFKILSFLHFDPRRFILELKSFNNHKFLVESKKRNSYEKINISQILFGKKNSDLYGIEYKWNIEELKKSLLNSKEKKSDAQLFWGIKMYAALGFPPYFGLDIDLTKKVFPMLDSLDIQKINSLMSSFL